MIVIYVYHTCVISHNENYISQPERIPLPSILPKY